MAEERGRLRKKIISAFLPGITVLGILFACPGGSFAQEDGIVPEMEEDAITVGGAAGEQTSDAVQTDTTSGSSSTGDLSGLITDTGKSTVSREGQEVDLSGILSENSGIGDGGQTINTGHLYEINGVLVRNSDFPSAHYECWTYANQMYAKIWGHNFLNLFNDSENMLRNLPDEELTLTPEHLKAYVSAAPAGSVLRICDTQYLHADDGWGHSQIIISHDEYGFTVFEGGLKLYPHRREAYYTWDAYCYSGWPGKYEYIKYIKWPGASAYTPGSVGGSAVDMGVVEEEDILSSSEAQTEEKTEAQTEDGAEAGAEDNNDAQAETETESEITAETEAETGTRADSGRQERQREMLKRLLGGACRKAARLAGKRYEDIVHSKEAEWLKNGLIQTWRFFCTGQVPARFSEKDDVEECFSGEPVKEDGRGTGQMIIPERNAWQMIVPERNAWQMIVPEWSAGGR